MLGIPETLINPNMTVFVCAAAAVPKPWGALQDQALKQLFFPFLLKQHDNYDFVMHSLWRNDKVWVAGRMVEFYQQENMLIGIIYEQIAGWQLGGGCGDGGSCASGLLKRRVKITLASFVGDNV